MRVFYIITDSFQSYVRTPHVKALSCCGLSESNDLAEIKCRCI